LTVVKSDLIPHQDQYNDPAADFFNEFNARTGREDLYWGYVRGYLSNKKNLTEGDSITADFGCGTGWLALNQVGVFKEVYGIDTSASMLKVAIANNKDATRIKYHQSAPEHIKGKCDFVSTIHVHYHFPTVEDLKKEFFQVAADLLKPGGEILLIGCPSDYLRDAPEHYKNCINTKDIPSEMLKEMSQISLLTDTAGFVPLSAIPKYYKDGTPFNLQDGIQMRVVFCTTAFSGEKRKLCLTDTYWSDKTLISVAEECGLVFEKREDLTWRNHRHAYMALHFKKSEGCHL
jgi:SAM-dependent methyltransferase